MTSDGPSSDSSGIHLLPVGSCLVSSLYGPRCHLVTSAPPGMNGVNDVSITASLSLSQIIYYTFRKYTVNKVKKIKKRL